MQGGLGNDTYVIDDAGDLVVEAAGGGTDTIRSATSYTLAAELENLTLTGAGSVDGTGNIFANLLLGNSGANRLDGGDGADTMQGGLGNDVYIVDEAGDIVFELAGQGTDRVETIISYTLAAALENLTLTGVGNVSGTGNLLANNLVGNEASNRLDGGGGADTMTGDAGNDTYVIDNAGDVVIEASEFGGDDTIESAITLTLGANVENLTLTGANAINGTGNALFNILVGNAAANILDGGAGNDMMTGGLGNDTYHVDSSGDAVIEAAGGGTDQVFSTSTFNMGDNIEILTLTGSAQISASGNDLDNQMTGNSVYNDLFGRDGNDTIFGGGGGDQLYGDNGNDQLDGGADDDVLRGGNGMDTLTGNSGTDSFLFDTAPNAATNVDTITDFSAGDAIVLRMTVFTALAGGGGPIASSKFRLGTTALDADDHILYDSATGHVFYDADGVGGAAAIHFATVTPDTVLTNANFIAV